jgi:hypothetical protein
MLIAACKHSNRRPHFFAYLGDSMPIRDRDDFLILGSPKIEEGEIPEVEAVMPSDRLGTGPWVAQLILARHAAPAAATPC